MKTKRTLTLAAAAVLSLAVSTVAFAGPPDGERHGGFLERATRYLELTPAQQEMLDGFRDDRQGVRDDVEESRRQMRATFLDELGQRDPDREALHAALDEHLEVVARTRHDQLDNLLEFQATLSDEQLVKVQELAERRAARGTDEGMPGRGPRGGRGGGR